MEKVGIVDQEVGNNEVRKALRRMRNGKAVGPDEIPVEAWTCQGQGGTRGLNKIMGGWKMPEERREG